MRRPHSNQLPSDIRGSLDVWLCSRLMCLYDDPINILLYVPAEIFSSSINWCLKLLLQKWRVFTPIMKSGINYLSIHKLQRHWCVKWLVASSMTNFYFKQWWFIVNWANYSEHLCQNTKMALKSLQTVLCKNIGDLVQFIRTARWQVRLNGQDVIVDLACLLQKQP